MKRWQLIAVLFAVVLVVAGVWLFLVMPETARNTEAAEAAARLILAYVDSYFVWPRNWEDLREIYEEATSWHPKRCMAFEEVKDRVEVDWSADPYVLVDAPLPDDGPPFRVVWPRNGSASHKREKEPNRVIWQHLVAHGFGRVGMSSVDDRFRPLVSLLRPRAYFGAVKVLPGSLRYEELSQKIRCACRRDRDWLIKHAAKTGRGKPLAYDPKLGVTREEYSEYLDLRAEREREGVWGFQMRFTMPAEGVYSLVIESGCDSPGGVTIGPLVFDLRSGEVQTAYGLLKSPVASAPGEELQLVGAWEGYTWTLDEARDKGESVSVLIRLGRITESRRGFIEYQAKLTPGDRVISDVDLSFLFFD